MKILARIVQMDDGTCIVRCPALPGGWMARASCRQEAVDKVADAVRSFYDIHLGLPKTVFWLSIARVSLAANQEDSPADMVVVSKGSRNVKFAILPPGGANEVAVAGDFSDWEPMPMKRRANGSYVASIRLPRGTYSYKFLVNGRWMDDPGHRQTAAAPQPSKSLQLQN